MAKIKATKKKSSKLVYIQIFKIRPFVHKNLHRDSEESKSLIFQLKR